MNKLKKVILKVFLLSIALGALAIIAFNINRSIIGGDSLNGFLEKGAFYIKELNGHLKEIDPLSWIINFFLFSVVAISSISITITFPIVFSWYVFPWVMRFSKESNEAEKWKY